MMQQYRSIRAELGDNTLLLFRLGDFYELFHEDARAASLLLGLTLTQRHGVEMAGIPFHAAETYVNRLLALGKKVAICDQVEAPKAGKLVKRAITRILTPGTRIESSHLEATHNSYLLAINFEAGEIQAAWLDVSTGDFAISSEKNPDNLFPVIFSIDAQEIILPESAAQAWTANSDIAVHWRKLQAYFQDKVISYVPDFIFDPINGLKMLLDGLKVLNLDGFGISLKHKALGAAGALVCYAAESLCAAPKNLHKIREYQASQALLMDPATLRNLEVFESTQHTREGSLIHAMDRTVTAGGARLLEQYLATPVLKLSELVRRQNCVQAFVEEPSLVGGIQEKLKSVRDIIRILTRLQNRTRNPRELGGIRDTINVLPELTDLLKQFNSLCIQELGTQVEEFVLLRQLLNSALNEELPSKLQDGGVIKRGYNAELDRLLDLSEGSKQWIIDFEQQEQAATGIKNLRIKYSGAFGYLIEVTKSHVDKVPEHYRRKQTVTNAERYYTEDLKLKEKEILSAEEKSLQCEERLYEELIDHVLAYTLQFVQTAHVLAQVDLFIGWALIAHEWNYVKPELTDGDSLEIKQGRHPVVEQMIKKQALGLGGSSVFVPNDTCLSASKDQIGLITGPNMAGKSTYIRQVALITLMAQVGAWVPAQSCRVGLVDRIFSRVGASDELSRGNSTFMVEMTETANILNNATEQSLIILDEIGRGTSTYDGLSIAWAVVEYIHGSGNAGPKTLFATHYHELPKLENILPRLRNYCVAVKEWNEEIIFVRQVIPGASDKSYGIQVARLAGLPKTVINRANEVLKELESEGVSLQEHLRRHTPGRPKQSFKSIEGGEAPVVAEKQLSLF